MQSYLTVSLLDTLLLLLLGENALEGTIPTELERLEQLTSLFLCTCKQASFVVIFYVVAASTI
jgi:hypothetical protein